MNFFNFSCHTLFIHIQSFFQQFHRRLLKVNHFIPFSALDSLYQFHPHFFIRNKRSLLVLVISQIAKMNQISQNIVPAIKIVHIILECTDINFYRITCQHFYNSCFQSVKVHIDQWDNCLIRPRLRPIASELIFQHHTDNRFRIIDLIIFQQISVIPSLNLLKVSMIFPAKLLHFTLSKTNMRC